MANRNYTAAERAPFRQSFEGFDPDLGGFATSVSNSFIRRAEGNPTGGASDVPIWGTDGSNNLYIGNQRYVPMAQQTNFYLAPAALQTYPQAFFIADQHYYVSAAALSFATANGAAMTAQIVVDRGVGAPGSGSNGGGAIMSNTFNMNGTANTPQNATLAAYYTKRTLAQAAASVNPIYSIIELNPGDRLSLVLSTTTTSLAGIVLSITFFKSNRSQPYCFYQAATAQIITQAFAIVTRPGLTVTGISAYWQTAGTDSGAVTLQVTQDVDATAPGGGTSLLASTISLKQTAGTVYNGTLSATAANLILGVGNRLSVVITGTTTALVGLVVNVYTTPTLSQEAMFQMASNTNLGTDQSFAGPFDRDYEVVDVETVWSAAGSGTVTVTSDAPGTAPGAGSAVISAQSVAGTINTGVPATLGARKLRILPAGYRLSVHFGGTKGSLAGLVVGAVLLPR